MATASKKRARSAKGRRRRPAPRDVWTAKARPRLLGREQFKVVLHRTRRRLPSVVLDGLVEHVNWERSGNTRTAELNFRRPLSKREVGLILQGDTVTLYVDEPGGGRDWRPVWRMVVDTPQDQLQEGVISVALAASLDAVNKSTVHWKFTTGKKRRRAWRADEITRAGARRLRVPLGRVARGSFPIKKLVGKMTFGSLVSKAYALEREHTGRRFDVDTSTGRLEVLELVESADMLVLGKALLDGSIKRTKSNLATALIVTSSSKKGHRRHRKIKVRVVDRARTRRYGYIVKTVTHHGLTSRAAAISWGRKHLARMTGPHGDVTFTHPGMPFLDRGQAVRLYLPEVDLHQIAFVRSVRHTLSAGSYEMEVTVGYSDPYRDALKERAKAKKRAAARKRKRTSHDHKARAPKPKKAVRRR